MAVAERVRDRLRAFPFLEAEGLSLHLTASIGIASLPDPKITEPEELVRHADGALYQAKERGRNCVVVRRPDD